MMKFFLFLCFCLITLTSLAISELPEIDWNDESSIDSISEHVWDVLNEDEEYSKILLDKIIESSIEIGYLKGEGVGWNRLGSLYLAQEEFLKSEEAYLKAISVLENSSYTIDLAASYNNLGTLFFETYQLEKAEGYYSKAKKIYDQKNEIEYSIKTSINLGALNEEVGNLDKAFEHYQFALVNINQEANSDDYADLMFNLGSYYFNVGDYELSNNSFHNALSVFEKNNDVFGISNCYYNWGLLYEFNHKAEDAIKLYKKALVIAQEHELSTVVSDCYEGIILSYSQLGNYDSVEHYFLLQKDLQHDIYQKIYDKDLIELETQYEVDKKERQLELEQERGEKMELANEAKERTIWLMGGGILLVVMALAGGVVLYVQRQRISALTIDQQDQEISKMISEQETLAYESQIEGERQERRRIAAELHDRVGGLLATINLHTEDGEKESPVRNLVKMTIEEVRNISHNLSESLQSGELKHALEKLKHAVDTSGKLKFELYYELEQVSLPSGISKEVYKVVQELTTNTLKHANAHQITLQLTKVENNISVIFEDDGTGYDSNNSNSGLGINNIHQRINNLGGKLLVDSRKGRGTSNIIEIPIS